ncbi:response regulator [Halopseudomonas pachastrellae]|jgi:two-component system response regulator|nr:two-component system response regulator [Pseudomonadales bacterium]MED5491636.1 response regulator [Pseudomonadota bacterium]WVM88454.1 response regulator [Halopseudomonas pachastrellae]HCB44536.1 two-component system response regulator [Pseudomonas sp.]WVM93059.1 response regulator [Halopseudomonas pachastrellae]|tara:strand:- start:4551 stop:4982 length:432 start_codon:yes stop_codon:yes gene_type:complete
MNTQSILLVEDNPDDIALMLHALNDNRIANPVVVAEDGEQALQTLFGTNEQAESGAPALILLDLNLPKRNGLEVLRELRNHPDTRLVPVVILTSSLEPSDRLNAYQAGANSYLRKPVDFDEFVHVAQQVGSYWLGLNQPAVDN